MYNDDRLKLLEQVDICCKDFDDRFVDVKTGYGAGALFNITYDKEFVLELIDGCENDYTEVIKYCPFCGKKLKFKNNY